VALNVPNPVRGGNGAARERGPPRVRSLAPVGAVGQGPDCASTCDGKTDQITGWGGDRVALALRY
jgi:hypothetical protein